MAARKNNYKFEIGDLVRHDGAKAKVLNRWWDGLGNRYEIRYIIGKNLVGDHWSVKERGLAVWEKK